MRVRRTFAATALVTIVSGAAIAAHFVPYPEATRYVPPNTEANRQWMDALRPGTTITAWLSQDTFEQVVGFYRAMGKEFKPPNGMSAEKLPGGKVMQKTFVIFDGAPDLVSSRQWIRIQRPFIGSVSSTQAGPQYQDVRDVTEIVLTERKAVPKQKVQKAAPASEPPASAPAH